ncbi:DUF3597 domain-containing protein [Asticcacaulis taihuensis]|uniref:DUF3597 domain-containing protein n=1 Tax=Asticcacaulis taihuensis TaxID=260084 RepID=UPI003F7B53D0
MSIFSQIKDFIFHKHGDQIVPAPRQPIPAEESVHTSEAIAPATTMADPLPAPVMEQIDVAAILDQENARREPKLNWRMSIVDLLKLVGLESDLGVRQALAAELGFTGDIRHSGAMNVWLHKQVMQKLAENGGKVPAELKN